jgi:putative transposase
MPRGPRCSPAGVMAHVIARGNARAKVFHDALDFDAFLELCRRGLRRSSVDLLGWCLMPNHVHLVARPHDNHAMGRFMHWVLTTHGQRYRAKHATVGHVWQGRYKSFLIQVDRHFLAVLRYVERNPVNANIVQHGIDWKWSSARERAGLAPVSGLLTQSPMPLPTPWPHWVDEPLRSEELAQIRACVTSGQPLGHHGWVQTVQKQYGLAPTHSARGRPPIAEKKKGTVPLRIST